MPQLGESEGDKFANEAMQRRLRLQKLREEKRKMLMRQMPGYRQSQHEPTAEDFESPAAEKQRRATAKGEQSEAPEGFGSSELKPAKPKGGLKVDDDEPAKRPPPPKGVPKSSSTEFVSAGVSAPPPPVLTRLQSIEAHERISRRVEEVQDEIEELEAQVEELMRMSRASRASRRASSAGDLAGQLPGPRRLSRAKSQVDSRQIGPETMHIGLPTNVRKTAGVAVGADGGFSVNAGDVRHVPKQLRKELGLLDISEPTPEQTTTAASVRVGADGRFEFDGKISEQMRLVLEDIERAKGLPPRKS